MAIISISEAAQQWQVDQAILYQKIKSGDLIMSTRPDGTRGIDETKMVKIFGVVPRKSKKSVLSHEQVLHVKRPIKISSIPPIPDNATSDSIYAGFGKRLVAYILDSIILTIFFNVFLTQAIFILIDLISNDPQRVADTTTNVLKIIGSILITWLYYSLMESSTKQGTLGKMALSIKVVDIEGNQISFWRATGRYFSKIVSALLFCIGYLMIAFTEKNKPFTIKWQIVL